MFDPVLCDRTILAVSPNLQGVLKAFFCSNKIVVVTNRLAFDNKEIRGAIRLSVR